MTKNLIRFIALLLVPCLIADPATAAAWSRADSPARPVPAVSTAFEDQALTNALTHFGRDPNRKPTYQEDQRESTALKPLGNWLTIGDMPWVQSGTDESRRAGVLLPIPSKFGRRHYDGRRSDDPESPASVNSRPNGGLLGIDAQKQLEERLRTAREHSETYGFPVQLKILREALGMTPDALATALLSERTPKGEAIFSGDMTAFVQAWETGAQHPTLRQAQGLHRYFSRRVAVDGLNLATEASVSFSDAGSDLTETEKNRARVLFQNAEEHLVRLIRDQEGYSPTSPAGSAMRANTFQFTTGAVQSLVARYPTEFYTGHQSVEEFYFEFLRLGIDGSDFEHRLEDSTPDNFLIHLFGMQGLPVEKISKLVAAVTKEKPLLPTWIRKELERFAEKRPVIKDPEEVSHLLNTLPIEEPRILLAHFQAHHGEPFTKFFLLTALGRELIESLSTASRKRRRELQPYRIEEVAPERMLTDRWLRQRIQKLNELRHKELPTKKMPDLPMLLMHGELKDQKFHIENLRNTRIWIGVDDDGEAQGLVWADVQRHPRTAHIGMIYIAEEFRDQRMAKALMTAAMKRLKAEKVEKVTLSDESAWINAEKGRFTGYLVTQRLDPEYRFQPTGEPNQYVWRPVLADRRGPGKSSAIDLPAYIEQSVSDLRTGPAYGGQVFTEFDVRADIRRIIQLLGVEDARAYIDFWRNLVTAPQEFLHSLDEQPLEDQRNAVDRVLAMIRRVAVSEGRQDPYNARVLYEIPKGLLPLLSMIIGHAENSNASSWDLKKWAESRKELKKLTMDWYATVTERKAHATIQPKPKRSHPGSTHALLWILGFGATVWSFTRLGGMTTGGSTLSRLGLFLFPMDRVAALISNYTGWIAGITVLPLTMATAKWLATTPQRRAAIGRFGASA